MFTYTDNDQLKKELKKLVIDSGMTQKEVAEKIWIADWLYTGRAEREDVVLKTMCDCVDNFMM